MASSISLCIGDSSRRQSPAPLGPVDILGVPARIALEVGRDLFHSSFRLRFRYDLGDQTRLGCGSATQLISI